MNTKDIVFVFIANDVNLLVFEYLTGFILMVLYRAESNAIRLAERTHHGILLIRERLGTLRYRFAVAEKYKPDLTICVRPLIAACSSIRDSEEEDGVLLLYCRQ